MEQINEKKEKKFYAETREKDLNEITDFTHANLIHKILTSSEENELLKNDRDYLLREGNNHNSITLVAKINGKRIKMHIENNGKSIPQERFYNKITLFENKHQCNLKIVHPSIKNKSKNVHTRELVDYDNNDEEMKGIRSSVVAFKK